MFPRPSRIGPGTGTAACQSFALAKVLLVLQEKEQDDDRTETEEEYTGLFVPIDANAYQPSTMQLPGTRRDHGTD